MERMKMKILYKYSFWSSTRRPRTAPSKRFFKQNHKKILCFSVYWIICMNGEKRRYFVYKCIDTY